MIDINNIQFWLVITGFIIAFILAFGIGANDVANSFGTSVGSKVLTLKQACILATIFEMLGAILIGAKVSGTIRKGILDPSEFKGQEIELMLGYVSALSGCCIWLIIATILNLPVSGTHSIVGATIGMAIVSKGLRVIQWLEVLKIVFSWFISPLLSGVVSMVLFIFIRAYILKNSDPFKAGLGYLPAIYTITIFINVGGVIESAPPLLGFDKLSWWGKLLIIIVISVIVYLSILLIVVPWMKKKIQKTNGNTLEKQTFQEKQILDKDGQSMKKSVDTQVDYLTLIVATKNLDQQELNSELNKDFQSFKNKETKKQELTSNEKSLNPQKRNTINLTIDDFESLPKKFLRLNSAPIISTSRLNNSNLDSQLIGFLHVNHSRASRKRSSSKAQKIKKQNSIGEVELISTVNQKIHENTLTSQPISDSTTIPKNTHKIEIIDEENEFVEELPPFKIKPDIDVLANLDTPEVAMLFSFLQVLTAVFGSFAHGGNDVSNSIGPLIGLYLIYAEGIILDQSHTPEWILFYGGVGISVGLWVLGRRVIKTIGEDLTKITASSGFVIELASAMTVLGASLLNIPVSTTHCKVGSVVFTGRVSSKESVDWSLFRNIIIAWVVTVPVTGSIAAGCQIILKAAFGLKL